MMGCFRWLTLLQRERIRVNSTDQSGAMSRLVCMGLAAEGYLQILFAHKRKLWRTVMCVCMSSCTAF